MRAEPVCCLRLDDEKTIVDCWLRGARLDELSLHTGLSVSTLLRKLRGYGAPSRKSPYRSGWLFCRYCHRFVHRSAVVKRGVWFTCPNCHRILRLKPNHRGGVR
jgi:hypothetical protein